MTAGSKVKPAVVPIEGLLGQNRDLFKQLLRESLHEVLEAEMTEAVGAGPGERSAGRTGYRAGYYGRGLVHLWNSFAGNRRYAHTRGADGQAKRAG